MDQDGNLTSSPGWNTQSPARSPMKWNDMWEPSELPSRRTFGDWQLPNPNVPHHPDLYPNHQGGYPHQPHQSEFCLNTKNEQSDTVLQKLTEMQAQTTAHFSDLADKLSQNTTNLTSSLQLGLGNMTQALVSAIQTNQQPPAAVPNLTAIPIAPPINYSNDCARGECARRPHRPRAAAGRAHLPETPG